MRRLVLTTSIAADPSRVFDLSTDLDLHRASMRRSRERAVAERTSGHIGLGESVTWLARHFGLWWTMTSRIEAWDRPASFVDEQVRGPFGSYRHEHRFTAVPDGTVMTDLIDVAAPFGVIGRTFEPLVAWYLERLITERNATMIVRTAEWPT